MRCQPDNYRDDIACLNLTPEQEDQLLQSLWEIMRMFVETGHNADSINKYFPAIFENTDQTPEK